MSLVRYLRIAALIAFVIMAVVKAHHKTEVRPVDDLTKDANNERVTRPSINLPSADGSKVEAKYLPIVNAMKSVTSEPVMNVERTPDRNKVIVTTGTTNTLHYYNLVWSNGKWNASPLKTTNP